MKVSIITAVYNRVDTLTDTIESVLSQTYPDIEYILIDGMSSDGTHQIVQRYQDRIDQSIREKDRGIYDALNKGIRLAQGDIVGLLHADDFFTGPHVIQRIVQEFSKEPGTMGTYGDLNYVDSKHTGQTIRRWIAQDYQLPKFRWGWMPPHPTVYLRRECYQKHGLFRDDFRFAADYELLVRMMVFHRVPMRYIPETLVNMRVGGLSNASLSNRLKANREDAQAWVVNGMRVPFGLRWLKPLRKLGQYF